MKKSDWKLSKRIRSFGYAFQGIFALFSQPNACIHLLVAIIVIACGFMMDLKIWEWCVVILCIGVVLAAEAMNTAIEVLADKISGDYDPLIGKAKDLAAGSVLLSVIAVVIVGLIIFVPKFLVFL